MTENVLSLQMAIPRGKYPRDEQTAVLYRQILDRVSAVPGVISTGLVNRLPLAGNNLVLLFELESAPGKPVNLHVRSITPDYFRTMNIPMLQGRTLAESDGPKAPLVGVVDERVARTLWPGDSAIGKRFRTTIPGGQPAWGEVVYGVPRFDPVSFAAAGVLLLSVALTASYVPARHAALTDPARTLKAE